MNQSSPGVSPRRQRLAPRTEMGLPRHAPLAGFEKMHMIRKTQMFGCKA